MTDYAAWIRDGLRKSGKMQVDLAEELGIHPSGMAKIMSGKRRIRIEELEIIAKFLDQPVPGGVVPIGNGDATRMRELEEENAHLKTLLSEYLLKDALAKR